MGCRLLGRRPRLELPIVVSAVVLFGLVALRLLGHGADPQVAGPALATVACAIFGLQSILDARDSIQELTRTAQAGVAVK